ncbi:MAG: Fe-S cluster assembly protein SufD, partial [Bacteroidetes bacterium]
MNLVANDTQAWKLELGDLFEQKIQALPAGELKDLRYKAFGCFANLPLPTTKHEEWKYTNLKALYKLQLDFDNYAGQKTTLDALQPAMLEADEVIRVVCIDGVFRADLSDLSALPTQVQLKSITDANAKIAHYLNIETDFFNALNVAFLERGTYLNVPKNTIVEKPIAFYFFTTADSPIATQPHHVWELGDNCQVTLLEKHITLGKEANLTNQVIEISVGENAHVKHYQTQILSEQAYLINTTQVQQVRNSVYSHLHVSLQGAVIRNNLNIRLDGQNIESNMYGLYMPAGKTVVDNHSIADHLHPNSVSNELYKGILDDNSTGVFNGKIYVREGATKTNAYQQNRNLLLKDTASVNTKPQLEIWNDDVKCSHGATTGSLDKNALFYLRARGVGEAEAKALLIYAFANEILEKIELASLRDYL